MKEKKKKTGMVKTMEKNKVSGRSYIVMFVMILCLIVIIGIPPL